MASSAELSLHMGTCLGKRRTRSDASIDDSKRLRGAGEKTEVPASSSPLLARSFLTRLPRELQDGIYEHAFGPTCYTFSYGPEEILTVPDYPIETSIGLPEWLLSSKQMCLEALEVFGQTRIFGFYKTYPRTLRADASMLNPLVLNPVVVRNVEVDTNTAGYYRQEDINRLLLKKLETAKSLTTRDLCLKLCCIWRANYEVDPSTMWSNDSVGQPFQQFQEGRGDREVPLVFR